MINRKRGDGILVLGGVNGDRNPVSGVVERWNVNKHHGWTCVKVSQHAE